MFKNPYAQFLKVETDYSKTWQLTEHSKLVGHVNMGVVWAYGNAISAPYSEQFYVGGANSIRAFNVRSIGPGRYHAKTSYLSYLDQTGDMKLQANLEYRPRLFGNLYGALFLDAGNVWTLRSDSDRPGAVFKPDFIPESAFSCQNPLFRARCLVNPAGNRILNKEFIREAGREAYRVPNCHTDSPGITEIVFYRAYFQILCRKGTVSQN